ncbi:LuxR C-terminal-related transcriptional regulator [Streptomyces sp. NPDC094034]|uniref:helix-turn-helix transcriptional regulator n=1 Tax=Streptomyces sp. NPDC094034 TaxID=3155309 RepID=UPI00332F87FD
MIEPNSSRIEELLSSALQCMQTHARMDMAFAARPLPTGDAVQITALSGARTDSLANLVVRRGAGLGGKALALSRPVAVPSYKAAGGITHDYDSQVLGEGLETLAAFPIIVGAAPRLVLYLGHRRRVHLGDRWYDSLLPSVRQLTRDIALDDEKQGQFAQESGVPRPRPLLLSRNDVLNITDELDELANLVKDDSLRTRLEKLRNRLTVSPLPERFSAEQVTLSPREIDVLRQIALGLTNRAAGANLGLVENTVKAYLKNAMRKLKARNRVEAIKVARELGFIN